MQSIGVTSVTVILATHENCACGVALLEVGAETGTLTAEDDGSEISKAVVLL